MWSRGNHFHCNGWGRLRVVLGKPHSLQYSSSSSMVYYRANTLGTPSWIATPDHTQNESRQDPAASLIQETILAQDGSASRSRFEETTFHLGRGVNMWSRGNHCRQARLRCGLHETCLALRLPVDTQCKGVCRAWRAQSRECPG